MTDRTRLRQTPMETGVGGAKSAQRWRIQMSRMAAHLGMGALSALCVAWIIARPEASVDEPGPPCAWLCDRDAGAVIGLDDEALVTARYPVPWPLELVATRLGTLWVLSASEPGPDSPRVLQCFSRRGESLFQVPFERALGLDCDAAGAAILLASRGPTLALQRVDVDGARTHLLDAPGASGWLPVSRGLMLFDDVGVSLYELETAARVQRAFLPWTEGEELLSANVNASGIWILSVAPGLRRLRRVASDLHLLDVREWNASSDLIKAMQVLVHPSSGPLDLLTQSGELFRYRADGAVQPLRPVRASPIAKGVLDGQGRLWCVSPGACLRLDAQGRPLPGQGGFQCLIGLCLVPREGPPSRADS